MKAILHYRAGPSLRYRLAESPPEGWIVDVIDETDADLFARSLPEADVLLHVLRPISRAQMELAPRLKLIQKIGVGIDTIDLEAAEGSASASPTCRGPIRRRWPNSPSG